MDEPRTTVVRVEHLEFEPGTTKLHRCSSTTECETQSADSSVSTATVVVRDPRNTFCLIKGPRASSPLAPASFFPILPSSCVPSGAELSKVVILRNRLTVRPNVAAACSPGSHQNGATTSGVKLHCPVGHPLEPIDNHFYCDVCHRDVMSGDVMSGDEISIVCCATCDFDVCLECVIAQSSPNRVRR